MSTIEQTEGEEADASRRGFFKKGAVAAATIAAVGVAGTRSAGAANGGNMIIGAANSGTLTTRLSGSSLWVSNGNLTQSIIGRKHSGTNPIGVYGEAGNSAGATGTKKGVQGNGPDYGVYGVGGDSSTAGTGVYGTGTTGVQGEGTRYGVRATSTNGAGLLIDDGSVTMPPATGTWTAGSIVNDGGQLWYCTVGGSGAASKWVRLSSVFVPLGSPTRVYDSRLTGGPLVGPDVEREIDTTSTTLVPGSATAVFGNFTVVSTGSAGFGAVYAKGATYQGHSNINFNAPGDYANAFVSATDSAGKMTARSGGGSPNIQVVFDIFGYWT